MGSRSTPAVHTPAVHDDDYAGARSVSAHGEATASALRALPLGSWDVCMLNGDYQQRDHLYGTSFFSTVHLHY